ncbi:MAG: hypothetical protein QOG71_2401 [Pyrinomonadaceae bacterium]|nr:hypothetical protein [Pyrinomonadaceae bacterium]
MPLVKLTRAFFAFCLLLLLAAGAAAAQSAPVDFAELEKTIVAELKENKTPGAAVAVVSGERVLFVKGFGATSTEGGASVTPDTLFRMGSTTKMFTAVALLTLADAGRIKLDAPIGNYVKNLSPKIAALTAHQLLSQSAGLRDFAPAIVTNDDAGLSRNVRAWKDDVFFTGPNRVYSYSSAGYWLAGFVVEELHGKPYADALRELLFNPPGMTRSAVRPLANRNGETLPKSRQKALELLLTLKPETNAQPRPLALSAEEMRRYVGKFSHEPQV